MNRFELGLVQLLDALMILPLGLCASTALPIAPFAVEGKMSPMYIVLELDQDILVMDLNEQIYAVPFCLTASFGTSRFQFRDEEGTERSFVRVRQADERSMIKHSGSRAAECVDNQLLDHPISVPDPWIAS